MVKRCPRCRARLDWADQPVQVPNKRDVWSQVLTQVELMSDRHTFTRWWSESQLVEDRGGVIVVRPANEEAAGWIARHYGEVLQAALTQVRPGVRVEWRL